MAVFYLLFAFLFVPRNVIAQSANDPYDLSFFTKGAAIGDSYAAGIGAGNQLDNSCSRYDGSYSYLVALQLGIKPDAFDFTYSACSGAVISGINDQAKALSSGQQFVIVSAGGNDADLVGILNSCVYSFYGGLSHPNCDKKLEASTNIIHNTLPSRLDGLINTVKSKLAPSGNIYYVGYAKFFDATDSACDKVSWHTWFNLFTTEYLTQARRKAMNDVVDAMNEALRAAVERAGPEVHFIDYDQYVGMTAGRFCQPGQDESKKRGANRPDLFFYQMYSVDQPTIDRVHDELRRRETETAPSNAGSTLNEQYGALIQAAIQENPTAALEDENASNDLQAEVREAETKRKVRRDGDIARDPPVMDRLYAANGGSIDSIGHPMVRRAGLEIPSWNKTTGLPSSPSQTAPASALGTNSRTYSNSTNLGTSIFRPDSSGGSDSKMYKGAVENASAGTIISNSTHALLRNGDIVQKSFIKKLFISDETSRVFHPTQNGHSIIANLILYQMTAVNAKSLGIADFAPVESNSSGGNPPQIGGAACSADSSDTWGARDAMISAVNSFCADPHNVKGSAGSSTSATFNHDSLDYMNISIAWQENANLGEHSCTAWLSVVADGCNVPKAGEQNWKHGGTIAYQSDIVNATLNIEPLVVRQIWDKGKADGQKCNDASSKRYLDQASAQSNINDYCKQSAAQPGDLGQSGSKFTQVFNDGTPGRVEITTEWPTGSRSYQIFEEECKYYLSVLNNGCSLPGTDNPMNWKHGGSISDKNGVKYTMTPTQDRPSPPSSPNGHCRAKYRPWAYNWDVWGGGFESSNKGKELEKQIRGCGAVTAWKFNYYDTPAADGTEWHASGTLPITISNHCLAKAVKSAGGFASNC